MDQRDIKVIGTALLAGKQIRNSFGGCMKRQLWIVLGGTMLSLSVHAASFDCAKAATKVEKIICGDSELSRLDEEVSAAYKAALKDVKHADFTRQTQKQWIKQRNDCPAADCVTRSYEKQLSTLRLPIVTTPAGKLLTAREGYTATLLQNGNVLIAGGCKGDIEPSDNAELYDPATNRFNATGNLVIGRCGPHSTLLPNGNVLVIGGTGDSLPVGGQVYTLQIGELYDHVSSTFSASYSIPHAGHAITPLPNGKLLFTRRDHAALYDPVTGISSAAGKPVSKHLDHSATLLQNGQVLFLEGNIAELYDPATNRFTVTGNRSVNRLEPSSTLLSNGKVLVVGGFDTGNAPLASTELFDPVTGHFTATGKLVTERGAHNAVLLPNGKVLIAGGTSDVFSFSFVNSLELYDSSTGTFSTVGRLPLYRLDSVTLLQNGKVLFVGGDTAELYDPSGNK